MQKILSLLVLLGLIGGGTVFFKHFKIEGLQNVRVAPQDETGTIVSPGGGALPPVQHDDRVIRIASFNIQAFGPTKASKPEVMNVLAGIVRHFDIVAVQEIRSRDQTLIEKFNQLINSGSGQAAARYYHHVLGPRLGRSSSKEQYAYIFDTQTIEVGSVYTIDDPQDLLHREPLVAQFRVRGPDPSEAFTFILANIHTDPDEAREEVDTMADVYRVVRQASSGEDDILLIGDFNVPGRMPLELRDLGRLGQISGMQPAILSEPTNARRNKLYDNVIFHAPSTVEFTGRAGVLNVMRRFNLTSEQVLAVSDHLPVWAEFSLFEDAAPGRVATSPSSVPR